jgi:carbon-monoxide dehydrogenase small subunit
VTTAACHSGEQVVTVAISINGNHHTLLIDVRDTLAEVLRGPLGLTGTKVGCNVQVCGACTILVDGVLLSACNVLAYQVDGASIVTIEGIADPDGRLDPIQEGFVAAGGMQCGFCTPGMIVTVKALFEEAPDPSREEVSAYLEGNLCRCTGYQMIVDSVMAATGLRASAAAESGLEA